MSRPETLQEAYDAPIKISDAASMLRKTIPKNEKPYTTKAIKFNNKLVDEWEKNLSATVVAGSVPASRVYESWTTFLEGRHLAHFQKLKELGMISEPTEEQLSFWKDLFENLTIQELQEYGPLNISIGWNMIDSHIRNWLCDRKWEEFYSKNDDFAWREKNFFSASDILRGKRLPFWTFEELRDIREKVMTVLTTVVDGQ